MKIMLQYICSRKTTAEHLMEEAGIEPANNACQKHKQNPLSPIFGVQRLFNYTIKPTELQILNLQF